MNGVQIEPFGYPSPKRLALPFWPTRVPDHDDIAQTLAGHYTVMLAEAPTVAFVTHSQGGLILQRFLVWMLQQGRGRELDRIASIVMLVCPSNGADYLGSLRHALGFHRHPQAGSLETLNRQVADTQRAVLRDIVNADGTDAHRCRIPVHVYAGDSDNIVLPASAQAAFPGASTLPGSHSSILDPSRAGHLTAATVRHHLELDVAVHRAATIQAAGKGEEHDTPKRARQAELEAERRSPWAVDVRGTRERVVDVVQRITLDRQFDLAVVESAGVSARLLRRAEKMLNVIRVGWPTRYWLAVDGDEVRSLVPILAAQREALGDQSASLVVHGTGRDAKAVREFHHRACADLGLAAGPTVLVGERWRVQPHQALLWLRRDGPSGRASASLEDEVDKALREQSLGELLARSNVPPLSALVAIARSGDAASGRWNAHIDELLATSSPSLQRAWDALAAGAASEPATWTTPTREFVALLLRGGEVDIPFSNLSPDTLREPYFIDEILRLGPQEALYEQLLELAPSVRKLLGLVDH